MNSPRAVASCLGIHMAPAGEKKCLGAKAHGGCTPGTLAPGQSAGTAIRHHLLLGKTPGRQVPSCCSNEFVRRF
jgi:hypothetical protein